ncbi:unnamed protein product [Scytosiphon promiscuus]
MEWASEAVSSAGSAEAPDAVSWAYITGCFLLFFAVIYLMCHTADNYFSPVLAVMCDLLDMPPEVAGVTFLAFGNGAPDVFSAFVALTSAKDREEGLLVGMGSLLGSTISTVTLIIGCVVYVRPTQVSRVPFTRDITFLVMALLLVLFSASMGRIPIWMASCYLALYGVYVTIVLKGPAAGSKGGHASAASSQDGLEAGGFGSGVDEHAVHARWIRSCCDSPYMQGVAHNTSMLPLETTRVVVSLGGGLNRRGRPFKASDQPARSVKIACLGEMYGVNRREIARRRSRLKQRCPRTIKSRVLDGAERDHPALGNGGAHSGAQPVEGRRRSLLGGGGSGSSSGGLAGDGGEGDALARVPGSTEEDDSAASWLAQRRWRAGGGSVWGRTASEYGASKEMSEPLLNGTSSPQRPQSGVAGDGHERNARPGSGPSGAVGGDGGLSESSLAARRFEHAWATIQWRQWRLRRRVRRELGNSHVIQLPWYRRLFWVMELPFILIRNATIPPVEADSWSQTQAAVSTALAPSLIVWAFGLWTTTIVGGLTCGWVAFLGGVPAGMAVWLTTHKRKMPKDRWYRLGLALVSFGSCVAWIYYFADAAVELIDELGTATGIPGSVLGLTLLAWGNSSGDLVTNLAVAKAGFPGMAIAGSYGGPLFNVLLGIGLPMFYSSVRYYPTAAVFQLDLSTIFTACMVVVVLIGTLPAVALSGFRFPDKAPLSLLGAYAVYMAGAVYFTLTFQG